MAATTITRGRLRRLAELRPENGRVLSIFLDLDPSEFHTPPARQTQITSVLDEAGRAIDAAQDLTHDELIALRKDVDRVRDVLSPTNLGSGGTRGVAVYACGPADLLEMVRLPHPVQTRVVIDDSPFIEPLAMAGSSDRWCVALVTRKDGRILIGDEHGLEELDRIQDDTKNQHDQGGWSQARFQRSVEREKDWHLENLAGALMNTLRTRPFDRLLIGAPEPLDHELEAALHPYLKERLAGRVSVDVENTSPDQVHEAAKPVFEEFQRSREHEALERLRQGIGRADGRAVGGREEVMAALEQQRVEVLLLEPGTDDVEEALERTIEQAADVLVFHHHSDLGPHGGIAALLRF